MINAKFWQPYYQKWLNKRIPKTNKIKLSHRSVFIVPNAAGGLYILLLVLMLITSINYQNNLLFGLTFWLFSLSLVAMILTFRNLARSEERRVGKECRSRWWQHRERKNK